MIATTRFLAFGTEMVFGITYLKILSTLSIPISLSPFLITYFSTSFLASFTTFSQDVNFSTASFCISVISLPLNCLIITGRSKSLPQIFILILFIESTSIIYRISCLTFRNAAQMFTITMNIVWHQIHSLCITSFVP